MPAKQKTPAPSKPSDESDVALEEALATSMASARVEDQKEPAPPTASAAAPSRLPRISKASAPCPLSLTMDQQTRLSTLLSDVKDPPMRTHAQPTALERQLKLQLFRNLSDPIAKTIFVMLELTSWALSTGVGQAAWFLDVCQNLAFDTDARGLNAALLAMTRACPHDHAPQIEAIVSPLAQSARSPRRTSPRRKVARHSNLDADQVYCKHHGSWGSHTSENCWKAHPELRPRTREAATNSPRNAHRHHDSRRDSSPVNHRRL